MQNTVLSLLKNRQVYNCLKNTYASVGIKHPPQLHNIIHENKIKARQYVVKHHFQGSPKRDDFQIVEYVLPALKDGDILVKAEWISVDPYQRAYNMRQKVPYNQFGYQVGLVQESKNPKYPVGCRVVSHIGWCDYAIINHSQDKLLDVYRLPDLQGLPNELGIGAVGMPGATAYYGFLEVCQPKYGETVVVTGAAGAVGTIVGQIAKIKGCKVIGFTGSDDKLQYLENVLGFDKVINYKKAEVNMALKSAASKGVDCYFDNVGGEISSTIIRRMNNFGRVSVCGSISSYNYDLKQMPKATMLQPSLSTNQIKVEGFLVHRWASPVNGWPEAFADITRWIKSGQIKTKHHVTDGFENIYDAFVGMLDGGNVGKAIVKV